VLASRNAGKVRELNRLFDDPRIELVTMATLVPDDFEVNETGTTFEENAWLKAEELCQLTGLPALSDDSGLEVDALDGAPGVYSARYAGPGADDEANNRLLLERLAGITEAALSARFRCVLAFAVLGVDGHVRRVGSAAGVVEGRIILRPRGENGFGYDPLFEAQAFPGRTTAEIETEEKNQISHRSEAARKLKPVLSEWLNSQDLTLS
jgi:XTP/dITP diphosphohydrolase